MSSIDNALIHSQRLTEDEVVNELLDTMRGYQNIRRVKVFKLINDERDYQNEKWAPEGSGRMKSDAKTAIAAWIIYMRKHLAIAEDKIYHLDESSALAQIRCITALGVACMENNETRSRLEEQETRR